MNESRKGTDKGKNRDSGKGRSHGSVIRKDHAKKTPYKKDFGPVVDTIPPPPPLKKKK